MDSGNLQNRVHAWTAAIWLLATVVLCARHMVVVFTGPPDDLVMANTFGFQLAIVLMFYVAPSLVLLIAVLIGQQIFFERKRSNPTPHPDARGATVQDRTSDRGRAGGRER